MGETLARRRLTTVNALFFALLAAIAPFMLRAKHERPVVWNPLHTESSSTRALPKDELAGLAKAAKWLAAQAQQNGGPKAPRPHPPRPGRFPLFPPLPPGKGGGAGAGGGPLGKAD